MSEKNQNSDTSNFENFYQQHGEVIGNICKNATMSFNSDKQRDNSKKFTKKVSTKSKISPHPTIISNSDTKLNSKKIVKIIDKINSDNNATNEIIKTDSENIVVEKNQIESAQQEGGVLGTLTYQVNIFGFKISVWVIIIIIFIVLCVLYVIYNYFISKKKVEIVPNKNKIDFEYDEEDNQENDNQENDNQEEQQNEEEQNDNQEQQ